VGDVKISGGKKERRGSCFPPEENRRSCYTNAQCEGKGPQSSPSATRMAGPTPAQEGGRKSAQRKVMATKLFFKKEKAGREDTPTRPGGRKGKGEQELRQAVRKNLALYGGDSCEGRQRREKSRKPERPREKRWLTFVSPTRGFYREIAKKGHKRSAPKVTQLLVSGNIMSRGG